MADVDGVAVNGCLENCGGSLCPTTAVHSTEHKASHDNEDSGVSDSTHSVPASKTETKTGD